MKPVVIIAIAVVCSVVAVFGVLIVNDLIVQTQYDEELKKSESIPVDFENEVNTLEKIYFEKLNNCIDQSVNQFPDDCFEQTKYDLSMDFKNIAFQFNLDPNEYKIHKYKSRIIDKIGMHVFTISQDVSSSDAEMRAMEEGLCGLDFQFGDCVPFFERKIERLKEYEKMNMSEMIQTYTDCIKRDGKKVSDLECALNAGEMADVHCEIESSLDYIQLVKKLPIATITPRDYSCPEGDGLVFCLPDDFKNEDRGLNEREYEKAAEQAFKFNEEEKTFKFNEEFESNLNIFHNTSKQSHMSSNEIRNDELKCRNDAINEIFQK